MDAGDGGARRKRKSRFSDPVADAERPLKKRSPTEIVAAAAAALASVAAMRQPPLAPATAGIDPTVLAKAAAAKIASVLPHGAAAAPSVVPGALGVGHSTAVDAAEQMRLEEEKRLRTEKIYKSVQDQMSRIRAVLRKPGEASSKETFMPAPLLLDDQGRQIDEAGNVIADKPTVSARRGTGGRGGSKASAPVANQNPYLSHRNVDKEDKLEVVDPRLKVSKRETYVRENWWSRGWSGC
jgi:U4/U6 small nuclear ribonucleoprotein PRP3